MKKIMRKMLFILLSLHTTVSCVIKANFPLSCEDSVACFVIGLIVRSLFKDVKKIWSNPGPWINSMRRDVILAHDIINLAGSSLKFLSVLFYIKGWCDDSYRIEVTQNGQMRHVFNQQLY